MRKLSLAAVAAAVLIIALFQGTLFPGQAPNAAGQAPAAAAANPAARQAASGSPVISDQPLRAAAKPAAGRLYGSPYVTDVTSTSAIINWVLRTAPFTDWRVGRSRLSGLKPGTVYYYDVLEDGTPESRGQFSTAPGKPADFQFVIYGDTRTRNDVHRKVVEKIQQEHPVFVVHNGDLVSDGTRMEQWPTFFTISEPLLREAVFFPMLGNHERNTAYYRDFFPAPAVYYSFDWGGLHVSILNSDVNNVTSGAEGREAYWKEQIDWLGRDLASAASADFRFVALHHPPFTAMKARQKSAQEVAARLMPILMKGNVQAVFSGHDHNYQHHRSEGIEFIITGGGGAPLYDLDAPIPGITLKTEKIENYVRGRVTGRECLLEAIALDGRLIDTISIVAGQKPAAAAAAGR